MSATYDDTLPTDLDRVRAQLGDTDKDAALHSDAHIVAVLSLQGSVALAVAFLARELVARYAVQPVRKTADGLTVDYTGRIALWQALASEAATTAAGGGISFVPATYGTTATTDEYGRPSCYP